MTYQTPDGESIANDGFIVQLWEKDFSHVTDTIGPVSIDAARHIAETHWGYFQQPAKLMSDTRNYWEVWDSLGYRRGKMEQVVMVRGANV